MTMRGIKKIFKTKPTIEGAGVNLNRGFGFHEIPEFDPFLLFDDFSGENVSDYIAGFPWHPHRGIETVTYVLHGAVEHQDSMGNKGVIGTGSVQWMTAGSGIIHQEMPKESPGGLAGFQLWVNLPAKNKMMPPRYQDILPHDMPVIEKNGAHVRIIAGNFEGVEGPVRDLIVSPTYFDITLDADMTFVQDFPVGHTVLMYIISGSIVEENNSVVSSGNIVLMGDGDNFSCTAGKSGVRFLLIAGKPLGEKVAWHGPIVMNTQEELALAFEEYQNGTFIK